MRGIWDPLDLMMIRDAALTDKVPKLSKAEFEAFSGRLVYNMGHACFEFMEARYGKEGIRQFLYTLRKGILGGATDELFKQAFRTTSEEFDERLRQVAEGALQAVPRPPAAATTTDATSPPTRRRRATRRSSASPRAPRARSRRSSPATGPRARPTWSSCPSRTGR